MLTHVRTGSLAPASSTPPVSQIFFAGNELAPKTMIEGEKAQDYLQRHYLNAILQIPPHDSSS